MFANTSEVLVSKQKYDYFLTTITNLCFRENCMVLSKYFFFVSATYGSYFIIYFYLHCNMGHVRMNNSQGIIFMILVLTYNTCLALQCYKCSEAKDNKRDCITTLDTCRDRQDTCFTEVIWRASPQWLRRYYITKGCLDRYSCEYHKNHTKHECTYNPSINWRCLDCCFTDKCNYNVTVSEEWICTGLALECYVCKDQENNKDKCLTTIKTCEQGEDTCLTEVSWRTMPYWQRGADKQFYISKRCATRAICEKARKRAMPYCTHIWYEDWRCSECCLGDRCNYYVILSGNSARSNMFLILSSAATAVVLQYVLR